MILFPGEFRVLLGMVVWMAVIVAVAVVWVRGVK
jgi:hypothetical protein